MLIGAPVSEADMSSVAGHVSGERFKMRACGDRTWMTLPLGVSDETVESFADAIRAIRSTCPVGGLAFIEVVLPPSGRIADLDELEAWFMDSDAELREDRTEEAVEILHHWIDDLDWPASRPLSWDIARDLAWVLLENQELRVGAAPASTASAEDARDPWAVALAEHLVSTKAIELSGTELPVAEIEDVLGIETNVDSLGERLLDALIDSAYVDEVFVDAEALESAARATVPPAKPTLDERRGKSTQ